MRQNRALRPDIATFTCAWMYQSLFSLCNNPPPASFHHLPPLPALPALLPALLAAGREDGETCPHLGKSLASHCHLARSKSSALFVARVTRVGALKLPAAAAGLYSPFSGGRDPLKLHGFKHCRDFVLAPSH